MTRYMLIDALHPEETRVVITENNQIYDFDFITSAKRQIKGNVYLAKITRVEPSLQAAFVEYGGGRQGFLPFSEIHPDYYQIPVSDRKKLLEEEEEALAQQASDEEDQGGHGGGEAAAHSGSQGPGRGRRRRRRGRSRGAFREEEKITGDPQEQDAAPSGEEGGSTALSGEEDAFAHKEKDEKEGKEAREEREEREEKEQISTLGDDDDLGRERKRVHFSRRYKIQEVIKRNQIVLVQVIKEERGNKGVSLSTYISLAGRYCVLMPNSSKAGGVSRKISGNEDRKELKKIVQALKTAQGMSVIVRTAGMGRTRAEIKRDFDYLVKLWNQIRENTLASTAPALVYEESDIIKRALRDLYNGDIDKILVEGEEAYRQSKDFMKMMMSSHAARVKHYKGALPIFHEYGVEAQIATMYDPVVKLRSGGYIVLNPTEALISIDVNSGRSTGERNIEETATKTNLEAAREIARQLRLRDLAGLIVIDFIDMMDGKNRRAVERALRDALRIDRAKIQLGRISPFGLMEMSRQRLRPSISETSYAACPHCKGMGLVRLPASLSIEIIRALEFEASSGKYGELKLVTTPAMVEHLLNDRRDVITRIEASYGIRVSVQTDPHIQGAAYSLERLQRKAPDAAARRDESAPAEESSAGSRENREKDSPPPRKERERAPSRPPEEGEGFAAGRGGPGRRRRRGGRRPEADAMAASGGAAEAEARREDRPSPRHRPRREDGDQPRRERPRPPARESARPVSETPPPAAPGERRPVANENRKPEPSAAAAAVVEKERTGPPRKGWWNRVTE